MRYFKPITIRSQDVITRHRDIVNDDDEFTFKYWTHAEFRKKFKEGDFNEALDLAVGESGVYSNYLKALSVKFGAHIKTLMGVDFKKHRDGAYRIHLHAVLRADKRIVCRKAEKMWCVGRGWNAFKLYKPELAGVAYIMSGHKSIYWNHPSCPKRQRRCRGKKGCVHKRKSSNDLLH